MQKELRRRSTYQRNFTLTGIERNRIQFHYHNRSPDFCIDLCCEFITPTYLQFNTVENLCVTCQRCSIHLNMNTQNLSHFSLHCVQILNCFLNDHIITSYIRIISRHAAYIFWHQIAFNMSLGIIPMVYIQNMCSVMAILNHKLYDWINWVFHHTTEEILDGKRPRYIWGQEVLRIWWTVLSNSRIEYVLY